MKQTGRQTSPDSANRANAGPCAATTARTVNAAPPDPRLQTAAGRAKMVGERMGVPYDHLEKHRVSGTEVEIKPANSDVKGKKVLIVDDMISTGGTIMTATTQLKAAGAKSVTVACTHGVYVGGALEKLKKSDIDELLSCNTLISETSKISVAGMIAEALKKKWF